MTRTRSSTTPVKKKEMPKRVESAYFKKGGAGKRTSIGGSTRPAKRAKVMKDEEEEEEDESEPATESDDDGDNEDNYKDGHEDEDDEETALSDALDDSDFEEKAARKAKKSKPKANGNRSPAKSSPVKGRNSEKLDGLEVVGEVVEAPKTGRVLPGLISQNTLDFLAHMKDPKCNDREWFRLHEPVYRLAEKEWKDFMEKLLERVSEVDDEVPPLPPKDVIHRIYRDIRFSNDKTPYKVGFSATFSRSGRKGIFAKYHIHIQPGGNSMIACGSWCPGKNELDSIRHHIKHNPSQLRQIISSKAFVKHFGPPKPDPKGRRQNVFGREDELKTAPKGVDKNHKDIDLLKLRSIAVHKLFTDKEVLDKKFIDNICEVVAEMRPFVHCLNDYLTIPVESDEDEDEDEE
ncbi:hypothetical protein DACRYDRAFT_116544 [Dacryopinax primogenitus]|uniref:Uncharacterized protein n=1 Tax=Dacryopinax primogenitus (strain DJM 731) TaxID=1858805 RepID=M5G6B0_DACPD|nr:uncharacterized protein DACRYDRAFT_116544 [Dacryopinax primogenitus]EJU01367.1 hypothetical protein DACRYDRAFT_116544 [Dacryopinax primogenitus]